MFYEKYSAACHRAGLSPTRAALNAHIAASVVSDWKRGADPKLSTAIRAAESLGLSLGELLDCNDPH